MNENTLGEELTTSADKPAQGSITMNAERVIEVGPGDEITRTIRKSLELANRETCPVSFIFNDHRVIVTPGDDAGVIYGIWQSNLEIFAKALRESPEYIEQERQRAEKDKQEREAVMVESATDEKAMRESSVPWPKTPEQLSQYIASLVSKEHDYGTCVYAMSMAAVAALNYVAGHLGVTGFQASCADMDIIRRTRHIDGPFMLINGADALYPQYDLPGRLAEAMDKWKPWLKEQAQKNLDSNTSAHPNVIDHWKKLAS